MEIRLDNPANEVIRAIALVPRESFTIELDVEGLSLTERDCIALFDHREWWELGPAVLLDNLECLTYIGEEQLTYYFPAWFSLYAQCIIDGKKWQAFELFCALLNRAFAGARPLKGLISPETVTARLLTIKLMADHGSTMQSDDWLSPEDRLSTKMSLEKARKLWLELGEF